MRPRLPVHPLLVHFPVALWTVGSILDGVGVVTGERLPGEIARWSLVGGTITAMAAIVSGYIDFIRAQPSGPAERTAGLHQALMLAATTLYGTLAGVRAFFEPDFPILALHALAFAVVATGAHQGGKLVYRYGVGVETGSGANDERHS